MFRGMNRNETLALAALIGVIALGLGAHRFQRQQREAAVWVESGEQGSVASAGVAGGGVAAPGGADYAGAYPAATPLVDLNEADRFALMGLPMIGEVRAEGILSYRRQHGAFRSVEELTRVPGIGPKTLERLRPLVKVEGVAPAAVAEQAPASGALERPAQAEPVGRVAGGLIDLNHADAAQLAELTNIGEARARSIIEHRRRHGPFRRVEDLTQVPGIGPKTLEANRARLTVGATP